jgi:two-component system, OmpR family, sensor histidine kinase KdpD
VEIPSGRIAEVPDGPGTRRTPYDLTMREIDRRAVGRFLAVAVTSLALASIVIAILVYGFAVPNPSSVYLLAVVVVAIVSGTWGGVLTALAAFLLDNFLFVEPRYTLLVGHPGELVNLFVLLFVGIVVGQLVALQRVRTEEALAREREARSLFQVSRALATRSSTTAVLPSIAGILKDEAGMSRAWISLGPELGQERLAADSSTDATRPSVAIHRVLQRMPGEQPAHWDKVHLPSPPGKRQSSGIDVYRVRMEAAGEPYGSIWAARERGRGEPDRTETRLLAAAADQIGQALHQDRLAAEAQAADIARQADALKSALLQSVSHDLRTPLATIRAAAGTLRPDSGLSPAEQAESADAIDREVEYLNRLVTNLLDLSRIEAGALRAERDVFELDDLVGRTLERLAPRLADRRFEVSLGAPPVLVDPVFVDEAVTNAVENALKYTPTGTRIRVAARPLDDGFVRLTVEDGGPGVPDSAMPHLFDKFYRVPGAAGGSRSGTGIGLAVVRGLIEATGGRAGARRSDLGGLAIDLDLPRSERATAAASELPVSA